MHRGLLRYVSIAMASVLVAIGWVVFWITGRTPSVAYQAMIRLFCLTRGSSNELMSKAIERNAHKHPVQPATGVLGALTVDELQRIARDIDVNGYHVFEQRLSADTCARLVECALRTPSRMISVVAPGAEKLPVIQHYDRSKPLAVMYDCVVDEVLEDETVQSLISDESLIAVAHAYLHAPPVLDNINLSWSTAQKVADSEVAQLYHFDMDRVKWLRYFIYVTDVSAENGPHAFVARSHRPNGIPDDLLDAGYARLSDEEVAKHYPADQFISFTGAAGTIIAEDTRGLHKGTRVQRGDRLLFHMEMTSSMFGAAYDGFRVPKRVSPALRSAMQRFPRVFSVFSARD